MNLLNLAAGLVVIACNVYTILYMACPVWRWWAAGRRLVAGAGLAWIGVSVWCLVYNVIHL